MAKPELPQESLLLPWFVLKEFKYEPRKEWAFAMAISAQHLKRLDEILQTEYDLKLSQEELLSEALRLTGFAKVILRPILSNDEAIKKLTSNTGMEIHKELSFQDVADILGTTIKKDDINKTATLLAMLLAYTEDSQMNVGFQAPSSTGKSYIALEIAKLFPSEDVIELAGCTPSALLYDASNYNKEKDEYLVNLERKIIVFLEQPGTDLLSKLRPLLSHDKKELRFESTDPNKMKKRTSIVRGFSSVVFCTAGLNTDEQEITRFLLLSPDTDQEKLRESIIMSMRKDSDKERFSMEIENNPSRGLLIERIAYIKSLHINNITIPDEHPIIERYLKTLKSLRPRHQRDNKRLTSIIKAFALLNSFNREKLRGNIVVNQSDIDAGFDLWEKLSESQELNLSPYLLDFLKKVIIPAYQEKVTRESLNSFDAFPETAGVSRAEVAQKYHEVYQQHLPADYFRHQILRMLITSGVVREESSQKDKREKLIIPILDENGMLEKIDREE